MNILIFFVVLITSSFGAEQNGSCNKVVEDELLDLKITKQLDIRISGKKWDQNLNNIIQSNIRDVISDNPKTNKVRPLSDIDVRNAASEEPNVVEWNSEIERKSIINQLDSITSKLKNIQNVCQKSNSEAPLINNIGNVDVYNNEICKRAVGMSKPQFCELLEEDIINKNVPRSCKEIQEKGQNKSGIYEIQPKSSLRPIWVLCDMDTKGGGWVVVQKRFDGSEDFDRNWRDYKFGFGNLNRELWIGLENMYHFTGFEVSELLVEITDRDKIKAYAHYKGFGIGSETEGYALSVLKGFSGDAGDSLKGHYNCKFTTKDLDQDKHGNNCAVLFNSGWWFNACHVSNLNGKYINMQPPTGYSYQGLHWLEFRGHAYGHAGSRMLVRPVQP
ncbi:unnamed protein product [Psylliodes chrysocephalus]|uniref:Fibrinogen C-terminal domain-containing protein n=1 Tax=Psylliodes chrysocephalus TaxID=3402493 RepID=A0A9P0D1L3_9CUCU|nr:unnamed protein product [Psylliodes chrysocephala]